MGGFGSGRLEYARTPTVRECRALTADELTEAVDHPGAHAAKWWGERDDPSASITIHVEGDPDDDRASAIRLSYTVTKRADGEQQERERDYSIPLEYTECNFGGYRPWFRCPGVVDGVRCGERVGRLYLPPDRELFLCRHCYDLGYRSSRSSGNDRKQAERRYGRAYAKLDEKGRRPHPNSHEVPSIPDRPKGMHRSTYEDLVDELETARRKWHDAWMGELQQMRRRLKS